MVSGSVIGAAVTLATTGTAGVRWSRPGERLRHRRGGRRHQGAMEGCAHRQEHRAPGALAPWRARPPVRPPPCRRRPRPALPRCRWRYRRPGPSARLGRDRASAPVEIEPEQRRHGADADRHRVLHGRAAHAEEPRRIGELEAARGGERRILAERMAGDVGDAVRQRDAAFAASTRVAARLHRHQRRLGVLGQGQGLDRAVQDDASRASRRARRRPPRRRRAPPGRRRRARVPMPTAWLPWPGNVNAMVMPPRRRSEGHEKSAPCGRLYGRPCQDAA